MSIKANLIELRQVVYLGWAFFRHTTEYFFRQCMYIAWSWLYFFFFSVALPTTYVHTYICIYLHMCSEFYRRKKCLPPFQQQRSISTAKEQILHPAWLNPRTYLHTYARINVFICRSPKRRKNTDTLSTVFDPILTASLFRWVWVPTGEVRLST
jgi:hypothetical protein